MTRFASSESRPIGTLAAAALLLVLSVAAKPSVPCPLAGAPSSALPSSLAASPAAADKGKPATAELSVGSSVEYRFEKMPPLKAMSPAALAMYAGTYVSQELLDARYRISVEGGRLMLAMRTLPPTPLQPMAPDMFVAAGIGNIRFTRDKAGRIAGFALSVGRAAGIMFERES